MNDSLINVADHRFVDARTFPIWRSLETSSHRECPNDDYESRGFFTIILWYTVVLVFIMTPASMRARRRHFYPLFPGRIRIAMVQRILIES